MKTHYTLLTFTIAALLLNSASAQQIPNGGFETWTNATYGEVPMGANGIPWVTNDSLAMTLGAFTGNKAVIKSTSAHSGSYALCIQESSIYIPSSGYKDSGGGAIFLGYANFSTFKPYGVPYNARPISISGYYKITSTIPLADTGTISATFRLGGVSIGTANQQFSTPSATYQPFTIPINWSGASNPDKLEFFMDAGGVDVLVRDTSTRFYVDDLMFNFANGVEEQLFPNNNINVYPNPANDKLIIQLQAEYAKRENYITIHDAQGKLLTRLPASAEQHLSLRSYSNGVYFMQLKNSAGNVLYGNRFNVLH